MRIAYICADRGIPFLGDKGASVHLRSLAAGLVRRGNAVTIGCRRLEGNNPMPAGLRVETMPQEEEKHKEWLSGLFKADRIDVVLERYSLSSGPALLAARESSLPFVLEVNAPLVDEAARYRGLDHVEDWHRREQALLTAADRVIVVSNALQRYAIRVGVAPDRITVVPNGVDLELFEQARGDDIRGRYGLNEAVVIGFAGSLKPWHGVRDLITAFALLPPNTRLLIVGDGPERKEIEADLNRQRLADRVVLTGAVPHAEMPFYLAAIDIAVAPYAGQPDFYFSPLKVVEYLAAGIPVVVTDQGDLANLVGQAGITVPPCSAVALAAALSQLVGDPTARRGMSRAARVQAHGLSWDAAAERVEAILSSEKVAA
jgi:glycosyltransferase involved in cell wall biosynthesis